MESGFGFIASVVITDRLLSFLFCLGWIQSIFTDCSPAAPAEDDRAALRAKIFYKKIKVILKILQGCERSI